MPLQAFCHCLILFLFAINIPYIPKEGQILHAQIFLIVDKHSFTFPFSINFKKKKINNGSDSIF